jgi:putative heme-binding domain-containing protein
VTAALAQGAQRPKQPAPAQPAASPHGEKLFAASCAGCHGLDARGGERAPNITVGRVQRLSDIQMFGIIEHGITGTGMPAFHSLTDSEIKSLVAHLRTLQGATKTVSLPGDPQRGKTLFFGRPKCSNCHMVAGRGGFIASDLSGYARTHSVDEIRSAITSPNPYGDRQARAATVTTRDGEKSVGRVRNEDNFSLQLQSLDGAFHFFAKSDIQSVEYNSQSLMPADYGSTLSPEELNDLISYLINAANGSESGTPKEVLEED